MKKILLLVVAFCTVWQHVFCLEEKPIVVIVPSYNNVPWCYQNLSSIFNQQYSNYHVVYIDDCSSDGTAYLVTQIVKSLGKEDRFTLIQNKQRYGALHNLYYTIQACEDEEIIVTVDGDDWLTNKQVFATINEVYSTQNVWLTHGCFLETAENTSHWNLPIPEKIIKAHAFRTFQCPSHLRTFYAWLFKEIKWEDLMYEGKFFEMTWDQAIMFPMIEMAGERHAYIDKTLYRYNVITPLNDNKKDPKLQNKLEIIIRSMPSYERLPDGYETIYLKNDHKGDA